MEDGNGHFMLLISPRAELSQKQQAPRDMVFVLDTSGSMQGKRILQAKAALKYCLRNLDSKDRFGLIHFATGIVFGWLMPPVVAITLMVLWEPLEILVLSPILARYNIDFGFETLKNSLSDIVVDIAGVAIGYYLLTALISPPFRLF